MIGRTWGDDNTTLRSDEAKSCPWCGTQPIIRPWHGGGPRKRLVSCDNIECALNPGVTGSTRARALTLWNERKPNAD